MSRTRRDWQDDRSPAAFALSAITGTGKTVIATAVIQAMLHWSSDLDVLHGPLRPNAPNSIVGDVTVVDRVISCRV